MTKTEGSVADQLATAASFDANERIRRLELIATGASNRAAADSKRLAEAREHIDDLDGQLQLSRQEIAGLRDQIRIQQTQFDAERGRHARESSQLRAELAQAKNLAEELEKDRRQRFGAIAFILFGVSLGTFVATFFFFFVTAILGWAALAVTVALWIIGGALFIQRGMGQPPDDLAASAELGHVTTGPLPALKERREI